MVHHRANPQSAPASALGPKLPSGITISRFVEGGLNLEHPIAKM